MENQKCTTQEIDKMNMDEIDQYIKNMKEYESSGKWVGFMGIEYDTHPPEPRLLSY